MNTQTQNTQMCGSALALRVMGALFMGRHATYTYSSTHSESMHVYTQHIKGGSSHTANLILMNICVLM